MKGRLILKHFMPENVVNRKETQCVRWWLLFQPTLKKVPSKTRTFPRTVATGAWFRELGTNPAPLTQDVKRHTSSWGMSKIVIYSVCWT